MTIRRQFARADIQRWFLNCTSSALDKTLQNGKYLSTESDQPDACLAVQLSSLPRSFTDLNAEVVARLSVDANAIKLTVGEQATVPTTVRPNQLTATIYHGP